MLANAIFSADQTVDLVTGEVIETLGNPILLVDSDGYVTQANSAATRAIEMEFVGTPLRAIFPDCNPSSLRLRKDRSLVVSTSRDVKFRAMIGRSACGSDIVSLWPIMHDEDGNQFATDELTGLPKRHAVIEAIEAAAVSGRMVAVHCIDLDRFKTINDTLGHEVGDLLLERVADRLRSACRKEDLVARTGGDEFVVVQTAVETSDDAARLAERIVDLVGRTYVLRGHTVNIGASVGFDNFSGKTQARDIIRNADLALYEAKRAGRNRFRAFEAAMNATLNERRSLEIDLRRALALKQFELHFQPFLDITTDKTIGFEALLRWTHPTRGNVPPLDFIPLAEETGFIVKLGEWVMRTACAEAAGWPSDLIVAVNVSPLQFKDDNILQTVASALAHSGLPAERLEIEITEGALLDNTDAVLQTLHSLRDLGVKISMDDFGTGYSSLSYLQKFPFSKIKIDKSFVQGIEDGGEKDAILRAVAGLGTSLGMAITAEGVETAEQLERIRSERCTHVQGYLTGRPMNGGKIGTFLKQ